MIKEQVIGILVWQCRLNQEEPWLSRPQEVWGHLGGMVGSWVLEEILNYLFSFPSTRTSEKCSKGFLLKGVNQKPEIGSQKSVIVNR